MSKLAVPYPWQLTEWRRLSERMQSGKMPHGVLLTGAQGIGKRHFALCLLQLALCTRPTPEGCCGDCKSCQLLKADTHPDLLLIEPEEAGKAIRIDQVREISQFLSQTAQQGGRKAILIHPADAMNVQAANALLKSLEEPGGEVLMVLVSSTPSRLLATVRSRCQQIPFPFPASEQALPWLRQSLGEDADSCLADACGAPLKALADFRADALSARESLAKQLQQLAEHQLSALELARELANSDNAVIDDLLIWLSESAAHQLAQRPARTAGGKALQAPLASLAPVALFALYEGLTGAKKMFLSSANPNPQLVWEECLLQWQRAWSA